MQMLTKTDNAIVKME